MDDANSKLKTGYCDDPLDGSNHHSGTRSPVKVTHDGLLTTYHTETAVITINFGSVSDETSSEEGEDEVSGKEAQNEAENSIGGTEVVRNHAQECSPLTTERTCELQGNDNKGSETETVTQSVDMKINKPDNRLRLDNETTPLAISTPEDCESLKNKYSDQNTNDNSEACEDEISDQIAKMRSERCNPFNRVPFLEENHFDSDTPRAPSGGMFLFKSKLIGTGPLFESAMDNDGGHSSRSSETSETMTESSIPSSFAEFDTDICISNAELGLTEDHFSHPEGYFGFTRIEELELAIENCKDMVKEAPEHTDKRRELVKKLVQLRMKLQELKEGPEEDEPHIKVALGHKFRKKNSKSSKYHCDKCVGLIWGMIQTWYKCKGCGYICHAKCLPSITRTCISSKISTASFIMNVCPESGLASQTFRCAECKNQIAVKSTNAEARLCDYSGSYYCEECHWNDCEIIPARVVHNWDFEPKKVSRQSRQFLKLMMKKAVIRIHDINPMLFNYVEELGQIRKLREDILIMKLYFLSCKNALESRILLLLKERQHFVDNSEIYSLQDLKDTNDGVLLSELHEIHTEFAKHIKQDCQLCQAKGFICELCGTDEVLYPFDVLASMCLHCNAVFHTVCYSRNNGECLKCERMSQRKTPVETPLPS